MPRLFACGDNHRWEVTSSSGDSGAQRPLRWGVVVTGLLGAAIVVLMSNFLARRFATV
jgi:hypothetical protein